MRLFAGSADPSALKRTIKPHLRRLAHHLLFPSFRHLSFYSRPRGRKVGVLFATMAAMAGGLAGWLGPIELVLLLVLTLHAGIAYLVAGTHQHTEGLPSQLTMKTQRQFCADGRQTEAPRQHRLLRLASRAIERGRLTEASLIYKRAIRECPTDDEVQTIARHSLDNLDLSEKIVKNSQA